MSRRIFPQRGTPEFEDVKKRYESGEDLKTLASSLGMKPKSVKDQLNQHGILRQASPKAIEAKAETVKYLPYPSFDIIPFKPTKRKRDTEDLNIVLADSHLCKITPSYNLDIAKARFLFLLKRVMSIISLHTPIRNINVFELGDVIQGENPYQGSKIGETGCGAYEQIHEHAVPIFSQFLCSLAQGAKAVNFYGVPGNHGIYDKAAPAKTNWDGFFYKALESANINQKNLHIFPAPTFYHLVNILGFRFFLIHGNQVNAVQGIPLFALRRKMQDWFAYVGGFHYSYVGHFHTGAGDQVNSVADYTVCPPMVTGDEWALEKVGRASEPKQLCFGVHPKYGRTWEYRLYCDEKFLPAPYEEDEGVVII